MITVRILWLNQQNSAAGQRFTRAAGSVLLITAGHDFPVQKESRDRN